MFVPFLSEPASRRSKLFRRKGGGKSSSSSSGGKSSSSSSSSSGGKSSSSGSSSSSSSSSSKGSSSSGGKAGKSSASSSSGWSSTKSKTKTIKSSSSTKYRSSTTYGNPKVPIAAVIPAGQFFAGRVAGGATRSQIYGTRTYGSGYPGVAGRGTTGRGFPFVFWPIAWPLAIGGGVATGSYLHNNYEYGDPTNSSRPGGSLAIAAFASSSSTFRLLSDNSTVLSLIEDVRANCTSLLSLSSTSTTSMDYLPPYASPPYSAPDQVVQYYRASTIALSMDGYNNTATFASNDGGQDAPLPTMSPGDLALLECLNSTIGQAAPLINGASSMTMPHLGIFGILWFVLYALGPF